MIVRCRTMSQDIVRRPRSLYDIREMVVRRRRTTSSRIVQRRMTLSRIVRHRATLIYKIMLASHHAIIVKSYVIVRLSFDCSTMLYDLPTISQTLQMRR